MILKGISGVYCNRIYKIEEIIFSSKEGKESKTKDSIIKRIVLYA